MSDIIHSSNTVDSNSLFPTTTPVIPMTVRSSSDITALSPHEAFTTAAAASLSRRLAANTERQTNKARTGDTVTDQQQQQQPEHELCDTLLAYELNQLSFQERNSINEEVHGVARDPYYPEETSALLTDSLRALQVEITQLQHQYPAYEKAQHLFPSTTYINSTEFRLIFVRCELFDARKAAVRLLTHVELLDEAWSSNGRNDDEDGKDANFFLERYVRISDFESDPTTLHVLTEGLFQNVPGRDRSGRRIVAVLGVDYVPQLHGRNIYTKIKVILYMMLQLAREDIETQRNGAAFIYWSHNIGINDFQERRRTHTKVIPALPVRFFSMHYCLPDDRRLERSNNNNNRQILFKMFKSMVVFALGPQLRQRLRIHAGSAVECLYILQTFGIQSYQMPIDTSTGNYIMDNHHRYIEQNRQKEEREQQQQTRDLNLSQSQSQKQQHEQQQQDTELLVPTGTSNSNACSMTVGDTVAACGTIEHPKETDILFGRGCIIGNHPGNVTFRDVVESKSTLYNNAQTKREKTYIAMSIVCICKEKYHSRFLKEDKTNKLGWWTEVSSDDLARQKVSIAFRDLRKVKLSKQKKLQQQQLQQQQQQQQQQTDADDGDKNNKNNRKTNVNMMSTSINSIKTVSSAGGGSVSTKRKCEDNNKNESNTNKAPAPALTPPPTAVTTSSNLNNDDGINEYAFLDMDGWKRQRCFQSADNHTNNNKRKGGTNNHDFPWWGI